MKESTILLRLLKPHCKGMATAVLFSALTVASNVGLLGVSALLISRAALHPHVWELMVLIVGVRFFGIARAVFRYLERYFSHDLTFRILKQLRVWFYQSLEPLAPAGLMGYQGGDLLNRIVADVETLKEFYLRVIAPPVIALLVLLGTASFLSGYSWKITGVLILFFFLTGVIAPLTIRHLSRGIKSRSGLVKSELTAVLVDSIQGMSDAVAFGKGENLQKKAADLGNELRQLQHKMGVMNGYSQGVINLATNLTLWCVLILAIPLVNQGSLEGTGLAMVVLSAAASFEAVLPLPLVFSYLEESLASTRRLLQIIDQKNQQEDHPGTLSTPPDYSLLIKNLHLRYPDSKFPVFQDVSFSIPQGQKLIITGSSGCGKSTLVHLLLRFWDYEEGSIQLGGVELKNYRKEDLHRIFGVVSQKTHLFNATIRENLLLAKPEAEEDEMIWAAQKAQIHDFVLSLPQGYDTYIGEGGFKISGGQRQRLAMARLILKDAPIWILDEATAHLDPLTELELTKEVMPLMEGKTVLIITHRTDSWCRLSSCLPNDGCGYIDIFHM